MRKSWSSEICNHIIINLKNFKIIVEKKITQKNITQKRCHKKFSIFGEKWNKVENKNEENIAN